jgi:hypothetical protein
VATSLSTKVGGDPPPRTEAQGLGIAGFPPLTLALSWTGFAKAA